MKLALSSVILLFLVTFLNSCSNNVGRLDRSSQSCGLNLQPTPVDANGKMSWDALRTAIVNRVKRSSLATMTRTAANDLIGQLSDEEIDHITSLGHRADTEDKDKLLAEQNRILRNAVEDAGFEILSARDHRSDFEYEALIARDGNKFRIEFDYRGLSIFAATLDSVSETKRSYLTSSFALNEALPAGATEYPNGQSVNSFTPEPFQFSLYIHAGGGFKKGYQTVQINYGYKGLHKAGEDLDNTYNSNDGLWSEPRFYLLDIFPNSVLSFTKPTSNDAFKFSGCHPQ